MLTQPISSVSLDYRLYLPPDFTMQNFWAFNVKVTTPPHQRVHYKNFENFGSLFKLILLNINPNRPFGSFLMYCLNTAVF